MAPDTAFTAAQVLEEFAHESFDHLPDPPAAALEWLREHLAQAHQA